MPFEKLQKRPENYRQEHHVQRINLIFRFPQDYRRKSEEPFKDECQKYDREKSASRMKESYQGGRNDGQRVHRQTETGDETEKQEQRNERDGEYRAYGLPIFGLICHFW